MPTAELLFVYGTLRRDCGHPLHQRLTKAARWLGSGTFQGRLFLVADFPGATDATGPAYPVTGEIYELVDLSLWDTIDRYEGYCPTDVEGSLFLRTRRLIRLQTGEEVAAWSYLYNRSCAGLPEIGSGDYVSFTRTLPGR